MYPVHQAQCVTGDLQNDLLRLDHLLGAHLYRLRQRGRTPLGEPLAGAVIEDGEAEGLLAELQEDHRGSTVRAVGTQEPITHGGLVRAREIFGLTPFEADVLLLCLCVEVDGRYGRLIAYLNDHAAMPRPTVGLALAIMGADSQASLRFAPHAPLRARQLVVLDGDGPLSTRAMSLADGFWPQLLATQEPVAPDAGATSLKVDLRRERTLDELVLGPEQRQEIERVVAWARATRFARVVVRGCAATGRDAMARALASRLRPHVLGVNFDQLPLQGALLGRDASWLDAAVVIDARGVAQTSEALRASALDALAALDAPVVVLGSDGIAESLAGCGRPVVEVVLESLDERLRAKLLDAELANVECEDVDTKSLAARYSFGPGRWRAVLGVAVESARVARGAGARVEQTEIERAARTLPAVQLGGLATRVSNQYESADLVVPPKTRAELDLVLSWARHRPRVLDDWDLARILPARGLACLFHGPPGTGKTLAAQVLARQLGLDLYRVDLSQTVSKYIGETEKNLARVFDEATNVVLFFDEADALFGKRTEVQDAHDRHANVEVSFLLQRVEAHPGITILATNLRSNMDDAFVRRLQIIAEFPAPGARERLAIWQRHVPAAICGADVELDQLATRFALSGAEIRNATLTAAFLAAADDSAIAMSHLCRAVRRELTKGGRLVDPSAFGTWRDVAFATPE